MSKLLYCQNVCEELVLCLTSVKIKYEREFEQTIKSLWAVFNPELREGDGILRKLFTFRVTNKDGEQEAFCSKPGHQARGRPTS